MELMEHHQLCAADELRSGKGTELWELGGELGWDLPASLGWGGSAGVLTGV